MLVHIAVSLKHVYALLGAEVFTVQATEPRVPGVLVYSTAGNSPAPTYFSVDNEGAVKVSANLTRDSTAQYEVCPLHNVHHPNTSTISTIYCRVPTIDLVRVYCTCSHIYIEFSASFINANTDTLILNSQLNQCTCTPILNVSIAGLSILLKFTR